MWLDVPVTFEIEHDATLNDCPKVDVGAEACDFAVKTSVPEIASSAAGVGCSMFEVSADETTRTWHEHILLCGLLPYNKNLLPACEW